jgi:hypothetical protein
VQVFVDFDLSDQLINFAAPKQKTHTLLCDFISCVFQQWTHMQFLLQLSLGRCRRCSVKRRVMLLKQKNAQSYSNNRLTLMQCKQQQQLIHRLLILQLPLKFWAQWDYQSNMVALSA